MDNISKDLRKLALRLSHDCKDGNLQSVFSCLDIVWTLYDKVMHWSPVSAQDDDRDFFIISKGQATLALFPVLIMKGFFSLEEMKDIGSLNSRFCIQTDVTKFDGGVENSAGSLGHGLPFATGIAFANKIKKSPSRVFVLVGDGEFSEGTMWESCIFAATKKLDNLYVVIDDNDSASAMVDLRNLDKRLDSFGFTVSHVDGNDLCALAPVLNKAPASGKPNAIIAHTQRGYGSKTLMERDVWFHKAPNDNELIILENEVDAF